MNPASTAFVKPNKGDFIGRDAVVRAREEGLNWRFATLEVHDVTDADARGSEAIYKNGELIGRATHGTYGWRHSEIAGACHGEARICRAGYTEVEIKILGVPHRATVIEESPFDAENEALRA